MAGSELPIVCTLSPNDMVDRLTEFETLFAQGLREIRREPRLLRLTLAADEDQEAHVRDLFGREQECCAFLTFTYERIGPNLVVQVAAPAEAERTLDGMQTLATRKAPPRAVAQAWPK